MTAPTPGPVQPSTIGGRPYPGHPTCAPAFCSHHAGVLVTPAPVQPSTIGGRPYPGHPTCAPAVCSAHHHAAASRKAAPAHVAVASTPRDPLAHTGPDVAALVGAGGSAALVGAVLLAWGRRTLGRHRP